MLVLETSDAIQTGKLNFQLHLRRSLFCQSPISTAITGFLCTKFSKFNLRFSVNVSKSSELQRDVKLKVLPPILSSKQMFFCNYWTLSNLKGKKTFVINKSTTIMGKIFETNSSFHVE